eukprot:244696-Alexandrium_andersonii.AAC.1
MDQRLCKAAPSPNAQLVCRFRVQVFPPLRANPDLVVWGARSRKVRRKPAGQRNATRGRSRASKKGNRKRDAQGWAVLKTQ